MERMCSVCKSNNLREMFICINYMPSEIDHQAKPNARTYVCMQCGHVEIYAIPEVMQKVLSDDKERADREEKKKEIQARIQILIDEKAKLESIVSDENRTVKEVREAKDRLMSVEREIKNLEREEINVSRPNRGFLVVTR